MPLEPCIPNLEAMNGLDRYVVYPKYSSMSFWWSYDHKDVVELEIRKLNWNCRFTTKHSQESH